MNQVHSIIALLFLFCSGYIPLNGQNMNNDKPVTPSSDPSDRNNNFYDNTETSIRKL